MVLAIVGLLLAGLSGEIASRRKLCKERRLTTKTSTTAAEMPKVLNQSSVAPDLQI
jgi:hypothetical protein